MPVFTKRELDIALAIGVTAGMLAFLMASIGTACLHREIGTPEYIVSLRNTGWLLIVMSILWTALAAWRRLSL